MNKSILSSILIFATGAAIGSFVSWKMSRDHYERLYREEVAELKERFSEMKSIHAEIEQHKENIADEEEVEEPTYESVVSLYSTPKGDELTVKPYVISPDEFGEKYDEGYETETLTYYADGVLTDDADDIIENIPAMVGKDFDKHFGEYEEDAVYVRNEKHKADYEILRDSRKYEDVIGPLNS